MDEVKAEIIEQIINRVLNIFRGERAALLYMTFGTILFFKHLVTRCYVPPINFPQWYFLWILVSLVIIIKFRLDSTWQKITCLFCSLAIGEFSWSLSNVFLSRPDMAEFIARIESTTKLAWIPVMYEWDNIVPSFYFITYFVSAAYTYWCTASAIPYMAAKWNGFHYHDFWLDKLLRLSLVNVLFVRSGIAFRAFAYLFSLLE